jgi:hypothetical protein
MRFKLPETASSVTLANFFIVIGHELKIADKSSVNLNNVYCLKQKYCREQK